MFLTRPPRTPPEGDPVRLACIRHAASVNPEPGSNSPPNCRRSFRKSDRSLFHVVRASSTMRPRSPNLLRSSARPDASVLHLRPPTRRSRCRRCFHRDPRSPRQPTCQCAALSSAHEQRKTAQIGRAALGLERICVSAPIVFDDLQSDTLRSLARARFGACQHLLTEGDYRHVETRVSRDFQLNFR